MIWRTTRSWADRLIVITACVYTSIVTLKLACRSVSWIVFTSSPLAFISVPRLCRRVCQPTGVNPKNPTQKFTPPLPDLSTSEVIQTMERLTLVPYGSTELRVTIFPTVRA